MDRIESRVAREPESLPRIDVLRHDPVVALEALVPLLVLLPSCWGRPLVLEYTGGAVVPAVHVVAAVLCRVPMEAGAVAAAAAIPTEFESRG